MQSRNLSPSAMFEFMAANHQPAMKCRATNRETFDEWKRATRPRVLATLGQAPERVPLNPELQAEWTERDLVRQKWIIDVGPYISAIVRVNIPDISSKDDKLPAILCWHGHNPFGSKTTMGTGSTEQERDVIKRGNGNFGFHMARRGYMTFAIDWFGRGERDDNAKPNFRNTDHGRDWCNLYYLNATMLGMTSLLMNITHGMAATDFICSLPNVDAERLGVMGISTGGTMALWSALCDERIKATEIICYSELWKDFGFRDINYCGLQVAPGLFNLVDIPDLQGLLAPRPLLVDIGAEDEDFSVEGALACFREVETIYHVAGAPENLELDLHPGGHAWGDNRSEQFFGKHLAPRTSSTSRAG